MGEFTGIHRKIDELSNTMQRQVKDVGKDVSYMKGQLDATLPELARTTQVSNMIADHKNQCRRSIMPQKNNADMVKLLSKIAAGLSVLAAAIYALVRVLSDDPVPTQKPEQVLTPPAHSAPVSDDSFPM